QGFQNLTPFAAEALLLLDEAGAQVLTLVAKATLDITGSELARSDEQAPIRVAPVHHGKPGSSGLKYESDAVPIKMATDVILLGHAQSDQGLAPSVDVTLEVGPVHKQVRVFGERAWKRTLGIPTLGAARPFERMPLMYERAFGGWDRSASDP